MPSYDPNALALNDLYKSSMAKAASVAAPALGVRTPRLASPRPATSPGPRFSQSPVAPLTVQPATTRPGPLPAGRQGGPPPLPVLQSRPTPKPVAAQPNTHIAGRGGIPIPIAQAGHGRGAAPQRAPKPLAASTGGFNLVQSANAAPTALNPINASVDTAIPSGAAAALPSSAPVLGGQEAPAANRSADPSGVTYGTSDETGPYMRVEGSGTGTFTLADAVKLTSAPESPALAADRAARVARAAAPGSKDLSGATYEKGAGLSVVGMGLSPEATLQKLKDQTAAVQGLNRNKSTGLSDAELAKVDARRAKDSEIFQLSQQGHSPTAASAFVAQRDAALAKQTAESPTQIAAGQQALATGNQELQKGALELQKGQQMQGMLDTLFNLDPSKPESKAQADTIIQTILAAQGKTPQQQQNKYRNVQSPVYEEGLQTGVTNTALNETTGEYGQAQGAQVGGAQAQPPPEHIQMLQGDPNMAAKFEEIYGPGSAAQYLKA